MAPHLRAYCQPRRQSHPQGEEIMGSRGVGCGRREQVEARHGTTRRGGRVRGVAGLKSRGWGLAPAGG